jgi:hypothetical protein
MLGKGKTKDILENSINSALLAVEIYNKPRTAFRVENYISLMIIAWTRLFHAYFNHTIGDKYYYKEKNGRYKRIDNERKAWELKTCITKYGKLDEAVVKNLHFFIKLRNKIEHRYLDRDEIGLMIFGECQSLLYNYENLLIKLFGEEYAINESLAFSLQFSHFRTKEQIKSSKNLLSKEIRNIKEFIKKYRESLSEDVFNSQEFSIKLIKIPKVSNSNRSDLAIEFVNWNNISDEDKENYDKVITIIKDKVVKKEVINPGKLKPSEVIQNVNVKVRIKISMYDHQCLYTIFGIRPTSRDDKDPFDTDTRFCHYDEVHNDYVYQDKWVEFIIQLIELKKIDKETWRKYYKEKTYISIDEYL